MDNLVPVQSSIDGRPHFVLADRSAAAADALARLRINIDKILKQVAAEVGTGDRREAGRVRLLGRLSANGLNIIELDYDKHDTIAINRNKSEVVLMCLRRDPLGSEPDTTIGEDDTLLFIAIHELAHSMVDGFALNFNGQTVHNAEFRDYEQYLMRIAASLGLLSPKSIPGRTHCSKRMPNPDEAM